MSFVSPKIAIPKIVEKLFDDIDPNSINSLGDFELGVWATPPGKTYVDGNMLRFMRTSYRNSHGRDSFGVYYKERSY
jgi:hypothetical protein